MIIIANLSLLSIVFTLINANCDASVEFWEFNVKAEDFVNNLITKDATGAIYRIHIDKKYIAGKLNLKVWLNDENSDNKSNGSLNGQLDWYSEPQMVIKIFNQSSEASKDSDAQDVSKEPESNIHYEREKGILMKLLNDSKINIAPVVYACGQLEGDQRPYMIMEHMRKNILQHAQDYTSKKSFIHKLRLFYKVFEAIDELHTQEVAHCNLNMQKIGVMNESDDVKLFYYDRAVMNGSQGLETPFFGAPDITSYFLAKLKGNLIEMPDVDNVKKCMASDVFSAGMLLLELDKQLLTKKPSWHISRYSRDDIADLDVRKFNKQNEHRESFLKDLVKEVIKRNEGFYSPSTSTSSYTKYVLGMTLHELLLMAVNSDPLQRPTSKSLHNKIKLLIEIYNNITRLHDNKLKIDKESLSTYIKHIENIDDTEIKQMIEEVKKGNPFEAREAKEKEKAQRLIV